MDYSVTGPGDRTIMAGNKERQGDYVFTANETGEYRFCFNNEMSTFAEKMVDFEIAVCLDSLVFFLESFASRLAGQGDMGSRREEDQG